MADLTVSDAQLVSRFESLGSVSRITIGRADNREWELFLLHHASRETVTFRGPDLPSVVVQAVNMAAQNGWLAARDGERAAAPSL
jgi:hypothetical protein